MVPVFVFSCQTYDAMGERIREVGDWIVDLVYPKRCSGCGRRGVWLCQACDRELTRFAPPWCSRCGVPAELSLCRCEDLPAELSWVRSIGPFDGWIRGEVIQIKYHGEWGRASNLGVPIAALVHGVDVDALVPVPLHPSRLRQRGFNQSRVIAKQVAEQAGIELNDVLERTRRTPSQVSLGAADRRENVKGAFSLKRGADVVGLRLVLIDDVITTGSTLGACAEALVLAGAASVAAITVAREL